MPLFPKLSSSFTVHLTLALRFLLKLYYVETSSTRGIFGFVYQTFGQDLYLKTTIDELAKRCKDEQNSDTFEVIQGRRWL